MSSLVSFQKTTAFLLALRSNATHCEIHGKMHVRLLSLPLSLLLTDHRRARFSLVQGRTFSSQNIFSPSPVPGIVRHEYARRRDGMICGCESWGATMGICDTRVYLLTVHKYQAYFRGKCSTRSFLCDKRSLFLRLRTRFDDFRLRSHAFLNLLSYVISATAIQYNRLTAATSTNAN